MNNRIKQIRYKSKPVKVTVGTKPGSINIPENALKPVITIFSYNEEDLFIKKSEHIEEIYAQLSKYTSHTHWIKINGLGDANLLENIGNRFNINSLVLEDIINTHQRPKFDEYQDYVFATSRIIYFNAENEMINCQFSALVKSNIIISFEENHTEYFEAVKNRLHAGKGVIRTAGAGYMCYALTDTILDNYFVALAWIGDILDSTEDHLYQRSDKSIMYDTQQLKRTLSIIRRASWPERDKINDMIRTENPIITNEVKIFLRDAYDHCVQLMDLIENYKEITSSIIDLYLSMVSNRMNEIMKVLTIISAIFIPLTFIAGVYGMNFAKIDPVTNKVMPYNLPELYNPHGYIYTIAAMLAIAAIQIAVFWKKGWFNKM